MASLTPCCKPFARAVAQQTRGSRRTVTAQATFSPGDKVKVKSELTVYHVPGNKEGLALAGMEAEVLDDIEMYKGQKLSVTLPVKIQLQVEVKGKPKKVVVHVAEDEIERV